MNLLRRNPTTRKMTRKLQAVELKVSLQRRNPPARKAKVAVLVAVRRQLRPLMDKRPQALPPTRKATRAVQPMEGRVVAKPRLLLLLEDLQLANHPRVKKEKVPLEERVAVKWMVKRPQALPLMQHPIAKKEKRVTALGKQETRPRRRPHFHRPRHRKG